MAHSHIPVSSRAPCAGLSADEQGRTRCHGMRAWYVQPPCGRPRPPLQPRDGCPSRRCATGGTGMAGTSLAQVFVMRPSQSHRLREGRRLGAVFLPLRRSRRVECGPVAVGNITCHERASHRAGGTVRDCAAGGAAVLTATLAPGDTENGGRAGSHSSGVRRSAGARRPASLQVSMRRAGDRRCLLRDDGPTAMHVLTPCACGRRRSQLARPASPPPAAPTAGRRGVHRRTWTATSVRHCRPSAARQEAGICRPT